MKWSTAWLIKTSNVAKIESYGFTKKPTASYFRVVPSETCYYMSLDFLFQIHLIFQSFSVVQIENLYQCIQSAPRHQQRNFYSIFELFQMKLFVNTFPCLPSPHRQTFSFFGELLSKCSRSAWQSWLQWAAKCSAPVMAVLQILLAYYVQWPENPELFSGDVSILGGN